MTVGAEVLEDACTDTVGVQMGGMAAAVIVVIAKAACVLVVAVAAVGIRPAGMSFHSQRTAGKKRLRGEPEHQGEV